MSCFIDATSVAPVPVSSPSHQPHRAIMWRFMVSLLFLASASAVAAGPVQGVSAAIYDRIRHFGMIALATYGNDNCSLAGIPRLAIIHDAPTDTYAWILRDDSAKEIIVSFRGTHSQVNVQQDMNWTLAALDTLPACTGCKMQGGYHAGWTAVFPAFQAQLKSATALYPGYSIVITGHR